MTTPLSKTRAYLRARERILSNEASSAVTKAEDGRATSNSRREWRDIYVFAQEELRMVRDAQAELPPE